MALFTVFYSHPHHMPEGGHYTVDRPTAEIAGREAADMLPEDLSEDEEPEFLALETIRDELEIKVYPGEHSVQPTEEPAYEFV